MVDEVVCWTNTWAEKSYIADMLFSFVSPHYRRCVLQSLALSSIAKTDTSFISLLVFLTFALSTHTPVQSLSNRNIF